MKYVLIILASIPFCNCVVQAQVKVSVSNIDQRKGNIYLALYDSEQDYMKPEKAFRKKIVAVSGLSETTIAVESIPSGRYAILLFLDENGNGVLDKNMWGIPKEKYGFSGDKRPLMRAPSFEEASVYVEEVASPIHISLR
ncbi:DUF2141 domain-containing protein [Olivibacter sitiensis]|uniref:DUF2141 domain-containing protein n=1 Tax=Olivibacter sitiensis TaxID=376470 RepID=UPI000683F15D|nr:DUF2141 domain-containing protein [Olivibacter sitiensis]